MDFNSSFQIVKPVLVVVTSDDCGHCATFKRLIWDSLKSKLLSNNNIHLIEISIPRMKTPPGPHYPADLNRWIEWYPTILMFTPKSWNTAMTYKSHPLEGVIFNGKLVDNKAKHCSSEGCPTITLNEANFLKWVDDQLKSPVFNPLTQYKTKGPPIILTSNGKPINSLQQIPNSSSSSENPPTIKYRFKRKSF